MQAEFTRPILWDAFSRLGEMAAAERRTIEIAVYGGSALMLTFEWRVSTRDVDAVFEADKAIIRRLASQLAEEKGWDPDWLNDGVKGFLSSRDAQSKALWATFPSEDRPGLRVFTANPAYLFAMKCRAMRLGGVDGSSDVGDIEEPARELGITDARQALDLITAFYPKAVLEPKTQFGIEEILENLAARSKPIGPK